MRCVLALLPLAVSAVRIVQSNDDGWAEKNVRVFHEALVAAGNDVVLAAPAENKSGSGSSDSPAQPRTSACQFNSCPANSPEVGADPRNPRLNYVNSFPVTSIKYGISTVAPREFKGAAPQFAVTGPNVGSNLDIQVPFSGTVGSAVEAVKQKIPAIAFSGRSGEPISFTAATPLYSKIYADLATNLTSAILASGAPYLPEGTWLNVNFPEVTATKCNNVNQFKFVLSRINLGWFSGKDVVTCNNDGRLPMERAVVDAGCFVSVSPGDANDKTSVDAQRQAVVLGKLKGLLSCLP